MEKRTHVLAGWGYEGGTVEDLIGYARAQGAATIVDVRLNAISRKHDFSKTRLAAALEAAGLGYVHLPGLGNPRENRAGFSSPGTPEGEASHDRYRDQVLATAQAEADLERVRSLAALGGVVLLCYEINHRECHRSLVQDAVQSLVLAR